MRIPVFVLYPSPARLISLTVIEISDEEPYDTRLLRETLEKIKQLYLEMGYIDFTYNPHLDIDHSTKTISCFFEFIPGTLYRVNRIHIFGAGSDEKEEIRDIFKLYRYL